MAKGKQTIAVSVCAPRDNFKRDYSFDPKCRLTPREELLGETMWNKTYCHDYGMGSHNTKETAYMRGTPSKFKHARPAKGSNRLRTR